MAQTNAKTTTEGPAKLLVLSHQGFNSLLERSPAIRLEIISALARRVRQLEPDVPD